MITLRKKILLASNSPRRKELLSGMGFDFEVRPAEFDEGHQDLDPTAVSAYLAEKKARAFSHVEGDALVLCADTIVVSNQQVLGKPAGRAAAIEMLKSLSDGIHQVYTSVCLRDGESFALETDMAGVTFRKLSDREINYYVDTFRPFDKAGAYGIQEWIGMIGVERIAGSFYTVMGLPTHLVYKLLQPYFIPQTDC